jgi:membrane protein DedA with SNARE-associated domain
MGIAPALGIAFAPALLVHAPLVLIGLNPAGSYLVVVATLVPFVAFVAVAATRRTAVALLGFFVGRMYGDRTIQWIEKKSPRLGAFSRILERIFEKWGPLLLFLVPGLTFAALAGVARMRLWFTALLLFAGQTMWMAVAFHVGDALRGWIQPVLAWLTTYMLEATAVCVVAVIALQILRRRTKGSSLVDLASEPVAPASE